MVGTSATVNRQTKKEIDRDLKIAFWAAEGKESETYLEGGG